MADFNLHFMGGFGNQLFQYAFARGYCRRFGLTLRTDPWVGQRIFELNDLPIERELPRKDEFTLNFTEGEGGISYRSYSQQQKCIDFYTQRDAQEWLAFRPDVLAALAPLHCPPLMAHRRVGDYGGYGYVIVSMRSYENAARWARVDFDSMVFATEENPCEWWPGTPPDLAQIAFLPDFWRMMRAKVLFRGNSTFSWWASVLGGAETYAPEIEGKPGGEKEQFCQFVLGNWPRFANLEFVTDLFLKP